MQGNPGSIPGGGSKGHDVLRQFGGKKGELHIPYGLASTNPNPMAFRAE
jgi:hypothetical protein